MLRGKHLEIGVDGDFTFDENMCDVESLEMVTETLSESSFKNEEQLPGVTFTKEQTFFINIAQVPSLLTENVKRLISCVQGYCGLIGGVGQVLQSHLSRHSTFKER